MMSYLIGEDVGLSTSQGCPVYYAVNYRNMVALNLLLKASDVKECVGGRVEEGGDRGGRRWGSEEMGEGGDGEVRRWGSEEMGE